MFIRPATSADIAEIIFIERESTFAAHWSESQYQQAFSKSAPRRLILVASEKVPNEEQTNAIAGFIVARVVDSEWEIENIVVNPNSRRQGIAMQLLKEIRGLAESENAAKIFLEVRQSNTAARALYQKCGFKNCGYRGQYYSDPSEDAALYLLIFQ